ncbi:MAG: SdiA-regulated domain-containing protein [Ignavibacteria bacterium]|nr:SdiA-regulated domain-containing protein [Ignavibacteria bacterium]
MVASIYLLSMFFLGCQKDPSDGNIINTDSTALKLLFEYSTDVSEPSGLAYNFKTNTLFAVSDGNSTVYELDFNGTVKRSFTINNDDLEGIAFSSNCDTMYVVDEQNQMVVKYLSNGIKLSSFAVNVAANPNNSLEGITVDNANHLFVINEKSPCMFLEFVNQKELLRKELSYTLDCSDIFYDKSLDCFWLISDESQKVVKLSKSGQSLAQYSLPFTKGEGITIVNDKIYIINDSNSKLYIFQKP